MRCPIDDTELRLTERQGIEIDYCPTCRGIWLDRGELDKLLERSRQAAFPEERAPIREDDRPYRDQEYRDRDYREPRAKSRRRSFLEDLLDFD
jgi:Zn-finger nucleic acid-binding protein